MERQENQHRRKKVRFKVGDQVMINGKEYNLTTPSRKLAPKNLGPYRIIEKIGELNYWLQLPKQMKIYDTFYAGVLIPYVSKDYPGRKKM